MSAHEIPPTTTTHYCDKTRQQLAELRKAIASGLTPPGGLLPGALFRATVKPAGPDETGRPSLVLCGASVARLHAAAQSTT
jgi:hypothetical protein